MAISSTTEARTQLNANLDWETRLSAAPLALEAVRWLLFNRPQKSVLGQSEMSYESLQTMETRLASLVLDSASSGASAQRRSFTQARAR